MFRRKPRITEDIYGQLMTSFGRLVDLDRLIEGPADALAGRVVEEHAELAEAVDVGMYRGAARYHLRLLAGCWMMVREGTVPRATADVFEEAVAWKFGPVSAETTSLPHRLSLLARGEGDRDLRQDPS